MNATREGPRRAQMIVDDYRDGSGNIECLTQSEQSAENKERLKSLTWAVTSVIADQTATLEITTRRRLKRSATNPPNGLTAA